jgi:hypothetical protein
VSLATNLLFLDLSQQMPKCILASVLNGLIEEELNSASTIEDIFGFLSKAVIVISDPQKE